MSPLTCAKMLLFSIILFISPSRHTKNPVFSRAEQCWHSFHTYFNCIKPVFECQKLRKFWFLVQGPFRAAVTVECDTRWLCVLSVASEWRRRYSLISVLIFLRLERYGLKLRYLWQLLKEISWYSELFVRHVSFERFDLGSHRNNGFFFPSLSPFFFFFFVLVSLSHCPQRPESWDTKIPLSLTPFISLILYQILVSCLTAYIGSYLLRFGSQRTQVSGRGEKNKV